MCSTCCETFAVHRPASAVAAVLTLALTLGADPRRLLGATRGQGAIMVGSGLAIGGLLSVWTGRARKGTVAGSDHVDVVSVGVAAAVLIVAGASAVLPAALRGAHRSADGPSSRITTPRNSVAERPGHRRLQDGSGPGDRCSGGRTGLAKAPGPRRQGVDVVCTGARATQQARCPAARPSADLRSVVVDGAHSLDLKATGDVVCRPGTSSHESVHRVSAKTTLAIRGEGF
jgi:hypothetical protein